MAVKNQFSIKDLENLSGVKAHTIRIWEKRYNLLAPDRTDTNIRKYNLDNLKRLLNVTYLYNNGYKISKIAKLPKKEICSIVENGNRFSDNEYLYKSFKTAMFSFDHKSFIDTLDIIIEQHGFKTVFHDILIPFLGEIGYLWQASTIDPSHERFISELIKQRVFVEIDKEQRNFKQQTERRISLFLPQNETHEIGLLYAHYVILQEGFRTVYLGNNIPLESLVHVTKHHHDILFLTYLTTEPGTDSLDNFFTIFNTKIATNKNCELLCLGPQVRDVSLETLPKKISILKDLKSLENKLHTLKNE